MNGFVDRRFRECMDLVLDAEGGESNDPVDRGGHTKYGISKRAFPDVDIASLTRDGAEEIYTVHYYIPLKVAQFSYQPLALSLFLFGVNAGVRTAARRLQFALNGIGKPVGADGIVGPATVSAANSSRPTALLDRFKEEQRDHYREIVERHPEQKRFLRGWYNRVDLVRNQ